jgi:lipopolysaccharide biosynthesis regulator YciM
MELGQRAAAQALLPEHPRLHDEASSAAPHQCQQCGARLSRHAWQCPACESWDSLRSIA